MLIRFTAVSAILILSGCSPSIEPVRSEAGTQEMCIGEEVLCNGICTDLRDSSFNCGTCGHECNLTAGQFCSRGVCGPIPYCSGSSDCRSDEQCLRMSGSSVCCRSERVCGNSCCGDRRICLRTDTSVGCAYRCRTSSDCDSRCCVQVAGAEFGGCMAPGPGRVCQ